MKKVGLIIQRYGLEVNGGAEYHCRILAEKLSALFEVEILTSCAKDHFTWANEYPEGVTEVNGLKVRRFSVPRQRNKHKVHRLVKELENRSFMQQVYRFLGIAAVMEKIFPVNRDLDATGDEWSEQQGPFTPGLISWLEAHQEDYDAFIFFTYLYYPAFFGLRVAPHKSILIPTAHDEPPIHFPVFRSFFKLPKVILYNTLSEKRLVNRMFNNADIYSDVAGVGIDRFIPELQLSPADLLQTEVPYLIYIGRIDHGKGADLMFSHFLKYKKITGAAVKLVLIGRSFMDIPADEDLVQMGFVTEEVKQALLKGAKALIMPSYYESLSLVTLESMIEGIPVIANGECEVLKDHIENSKGGFTFTDFDNFKAAVDQVLNNEAELFTLKQNAREYVTENYNWTVIMEKFVRAIDFIQHKGSDS